MSENRDHPRTLDEFLVEIVGMTIDLDSMALAEAPTQRVAAASRPPDLLGRFLVTGRLGTGGMGDVLEVRDPDLCRTLAAKVVRDTRDRARLRKFVLEAQVTGQLEHPNIVPVHELGLTPSGRLFFTMKRIAGRDLQEILSSLNPLADFDDPAHSPSFSELLQIFQKVCDAIAYAHSRGVIHRDLKPANVMVGPFGEVLVCDWGVAKVVGRGDAEDPAAASLTLDLDPRRLSTPDSGPGEILRTLDGDVVGTPAYMPPEQATGKISQLDRRSDVYSLGAILYQMLTLSPPFAASHPIGVLGQVVNGDLIPPSGRAPHRRVPWELEAAALKAMARQPAERYQDVGGLRADIARFLEGRALEAARYGPLALAVKLASRHRALVGALLAFVVLGLAGATASYRRVAAERDAASAARRQVVEKIDELEESRRNEAGLLTAARRAHLRERLERRRAQRHLVTALVKAAEAATRAGDHGAGALLALEALDLAPEDPRARFLFFTRRHMFTPKLGAPLPSAVKARSASVRIPDSYGADGRTLTLFEADGHRVVDAFWNRRLHREPAAKPVLPDSPLRDRRFRLVESGDRKRAILDPRGREVLRLVGPGERIVGGAWVVVADGDILWIFPGEKILHHSYEPGAARLRTRLGTGRRVVGVEVVPLPRPRPLPPLLERVAGRPGSFPMPPEFLAGADPGAMGALARTDDPAHAWLRLFRMLAGRPEAAPLLMQLEYDLERQLEKEGSSSVHDLVRLVLEICREGMNSSRRLALHAKVDSLPGPLRNRWRAWLQMR